MATFEFEFGAKLANDVRFYERLPQKPGKKKPNPLMRAEAAGEHSPEPMFEDTDEPELDKESAAYKFGKSMCNYLDMSKHDKSQYQTGPMRALAAEEAVAPADGGVQNTEETEHAEKDISNSGQKKSNYLKQAGTPYNIGTLVRRGIDAVSGAKPGTAAKTITGAPTSPPVSGRPATGALRGARVPAVDLPTLPARTAPKITIAPDEVAGTQSKVTIRPDEVGVQPRRVTITPQELAEMERMNAARRGYSLPTAAPTSAPAAPKIPIAKNVTKPPRVGAAGTGSAGKGVVKAVDGDVFTVEFPGGVTKQYRTNTQAPATASAPAAPPTAARRGPTPPPPSVPPKPRPPQPTTPTQSAPPPTQPPRPTKPVTAQPAAAPAAAPVRTPSMADRAFSAARSYGNATGLLPTSTAGLAMAGINPFLQNTVAPAIDNRYGTNFSGRDPNRTDLSTRAGQALFPTQRAWSAVANQPIINGQSARQFGQQLLQRGVNALPNFQ